MRRDLSSWLGTLGMTNRKATYRRSRTNHTLKSRGAAHAISLAGGEPLDSRKMLAVTAQEVGGALVISLGDENDIAGLVFNTGTSKYEVYDNTTFVEAFDAATVETIDVIDVAPSGEDQGQVFEVRNGGAIAASLGVSNLIETTKIFGDIGVTSATTITGGYGVVISSPTIILDDATPAGALLIETNNTDIEFGGVVTIIDDSQVTIGTDTGAGDIDFLDDILGGGEDGSGTLTLAAGTGAITFGGDIGGAGGGEELHGVLISSAASASANGLFHITDALGDDFADGLTISDGVNNVNFENGGEITGFGEDGAGIFINGSSTNSTISGFLLTGNTYGIYAGNYFDTLATSDLSGTVIDDNVIGEDDFGIYLDSVAGNLDGEDAFVIGGTAGNVIAANGEDGIYGFASTGVEIRNNFFFANGEDGLGAGSGISLEGGGEYLITGNTIGIGEDGVPPVGLGNSYDGITIDGEDGFYSYAGTEIVGNDIEYNAAYGVRVQGVTLDTGEDSILIFDNLIANNGASLTPAQVGGIRIDGSENIRIINNDILFNGEDAGNGIDIVNGSHGTAVFLNNIVQNANHGIYVENSSTAANPVQIGDVLPITDVGSTTVTTDGDARAAILPGQQIGLAYVVDPTDVSTATLITRTVQSVVYDDDATTITFTSNVPGSPYALTLGNYIFGNGDDSDDGGSGISVLATGEGTPGTVEGIEILGNVIVGNDGSGIRLESNRAASFGDLSGALIAGNFVGRDPVGEDSPTDLGNGGDGIRVINGDSIAIQANYVADNVDGMDIEGSLNVDIGEDGLGNYIVRNVNDGVGISESQYVTVVDNEIANNGSDGVYVYLSQDVLIENNWIHDNTSRGVGVQSSDRVEITDNLVEFNGDNGINFFDGEDALVSFNIIKDNVDDGVFFGATNGVIEGNEIYENGDDGVDIDGLGGSYPGEDVHFEVLGNIIRDNGDDGVDISNGSFTGLDRDGEEGPSRVAGNTIERNFDNGVTLGDLSGVVVGGEFPSDINFINLNGDAGVRAYGIVNASVIGNEIDSNVNYGVEIDNGEDLTVGGPSDEAVNTIRRNGIAGVYAFGETFGTEVYNNEISENPIGVMIDSALGLQVGGPNSEGEDYGNHIFDNGQGVRATGDSYGTAVQGNLIEDNLTGATLASVRGLTFGYGEAPRALPEGSFGNIVRFNNEGLRGSGDLTDTVVAGNEFINNTKVGIALQSAKNLTVGGIGEDSPNFISGSPVGLSASGTMTDTLVFLNEFSENTIGISLSRATGMLVGANLIDQSTQYGISVTGNNAGTDIGFNLVTNTGNAPGIGIYLNGARNVDIGGNDVQGSVFAGLYATGNTSGTAVQGNLFTDNRIGMFIDGATNAVFGGLGEDEGNTIIGNSDALSGKYREGILARGVCSGSSIVGTDITDTSTGVWLQSVTGLGVSNSTITDSEFYGLTATGTLTGSSFNDNSIVGSEAVPGPGHAMHLVDAQGLSVLGNTAESNAGAGLYVTGTTTGTKVQDNLFTDNRIGIQVLNATNAVIGGAGVGEGNTIDGQSDAIAGIFREGVMVQGTQSGTSITGTTISDTSTGVWLMSQSVTMAGTTVTDSEFYGVYASGDLTGSSFVDGTISDSLASPGPGYGMNLNGAQNLLIEGNTFDGNGGAGLSIAGNTSGTRVYDNDFTDNRIAIRMVDATNAVIGGTVSGEDNRIVGGGNPAIADYRDGVVAAGLLTGSTVQNLSITTTVTGVLLQAAQGLALTDITMTKVQWYGVNATGDLSGTTFKNSSIDKTGFGTAVGFGVVLASAQGLVFEDNEISDSVQAGMLASGDCTGTSVIDTTWSNTTNLIDNSGGTLAVTPPAP